MVAPPTYIAPVRKAVQRGAGSFAFLGDTLSSLVPPSDHVFLRTTAPSLVALPLPVTNPAFGATGVGEGEGGEEEGGVGMGGMGGVGDGKGGRGMGRVGGMGGDGGWEEDVVRQKEMEMQQEIQAEQKRFEFYEKQAQEKERLLREAEKEEEEKRERERLRRRQFEEEQEQALSRAQDFSFLENTGLEDFQMGGDTFDNFSGY